MARLISRINRRSSLLLSAQETILKQSTAWKITSVQAMAQGCLNVVSSHSIGILFPPVADADHTNNREYKTKITGLLIS